jgi:hypothetical protein
MRWSLVAAVPISRIAAINASAGWASAFQRIYMTASNLVVMFVSEDYAKKSWPRLERQSALARALKERRECILRCGSTTSCCPGLDPNLGYLPLENRPPAKLAEAIMKKLVGERVEPVKPACRLRDDWDDGRDACRVVSTHCTAVNGPATVRLSTQRTSAT